MEVLIFGGTKQMGIYLVRELLRNPKKYSLTLANRGVTPDVFGNKVKRIKIDRNDTEKVREIFNDKYYDVIIDFIAYSADNVNTLLSIVKTQKYILISSNVVYNPLKENYRPEDFIPEDYSPKDFQLTTGDYDYQIGKRATENALISYDIKKLILRVPFVSGVNDVTPRMYDWVDYVYNGKLLSLNKELIKNRFSMAHTSDCGKFISYALENNLTGIYNIASQGTISISEIINYIELKSGKKANISWVKKDKHNFHYNVPDNYANVDNVNEAGYHFQHIDDWLWDTLDSLIYAETKIAEKNFIINRNFVQRHISNRLNYLNSHGKNIFSLYLDRNIRQINMYAEREFLSTVAELYELAVWSGVTIKNFYADVEIDLSVNTYDGKTNTIRTKLYDPNTADTAPYFTTAHNTSFIHSEHHSFSEMFNYAYSKGVNIKQFRDNTLRPTRVIVTGGGSGIGFAIAKALIAEGCSVVITGRNTEKLKKAQLQLGEKCHILQWDISDVSIINEKFNEACVLLGGYFDGIVNNAGVFKKYSYWDTDEMDYDNVMNIDLKAPVFIMQKATIYMRYNHIGGNILNISSVCGHNGYHLADAYSTAKSSLINITRALAKDAMRHNIVINGVAPGETVSKITPRQDIPFEHIAISRIIESEEIANIALFMLSDQAKICVGETIIADGGAKWTF